MTQSSTRDVPVIRKGGYYLTQPRKPWLVNGLIREGTTTFVSGKEGTGKSIIALELAACIGESRAFLSNGVGAGEVLYIAAERGELQRERLEALRDAKGVNPDTIHFVDFQFKLNRPADEALLHAAIDKAGLHPKLIIIDTLRASFEGDENASATAQATMDAFARIRRRYDATLVVLHHVNAFGQARGSSAFIGAADTELYVTSSKTTRRVYLTVRKQNNGRTWLKYVLVPQELAFGNDYSSIVLNLEGTEESDRAPEEEEGNTARDDQIVRIVAGSAEPLGLNRLQKELASIEGTERNKATLKQDVLRLATAGRLAVAQETSGHFRIGRPTGGEG